MVVASLCHLHLVTVIFTYNCKSISTVIERGVSMCYIVRHSFMMPKFVGRHSTARDGVCFMENFCNTKKTVARCFPARHGIAAQASPSPCPRWIKISWQTFSQLPNIRHEFTTTAPRSFTTMSSGHTPGLRFGIVIMKTHASWVSPRSPSRVLRKIPDDRNAKNAHVC